MEARKENKKEKKKKKAPSKGCAWDKTAQMGHTDAIQGRGVPTVPTKNQVAIN